MRRRLLPPRQGRQGLTWRAGKGRARGGWRLPPGLAESAIRDIIRVSRLGQASEPVVPLRRPSQSVVRMRLPIASSEPSESVVRVSRRRQSPEWNRVCLLSAAPGSACSREAHFMQPRETSRAAGRPICALRGPCARPKPCARGVGDTRLDELHATCFVLRILAAGQDTRATLTWSVSRLSCLRPTRMGLRPTRRQELAPPWGCCHHPGPA